MALSNWDTWAKDFNNKSVPAKFKAGDIVISIYKNWLNIEVNGTHCEVQEGNFTIGLVDILAIRGPRNGIYVYVKTGWEHNNTLTGILMCGVYGYEDKEFVGVTEECIDFFKTQIGIWKEEHYIDVPDDFTFEDGKRYNQGDAYFAKQLHADAGEGDGSEIDAVSTKIGKQQKTIMHKVIEKMSGEENSEK